MEGDPKFEAQLKEKLANLNAVELKDLKKESEEDLMMMKDVIELLDQTMEKIRESWMCIARAYELSLMCKNKILLPLTNTVYAEALLKGHKGVIVDLGGNYMVFMGFGEAMDCLERAIETLDRRKEGLMETILEITAYNLSVRQTMAHKHEKVEAPLGLQDQ